MFKVGDRIECVNNEMAQNLLILGKIYEVIENVYNAFGNRIVIKDDLNLIHWSPSRFKLAKTKKDYKYYDLLEKMNEKSN